MEDYVAIVLGGPRLLDFRRFPLAAPAAGTALVRIARCGICGTDVQAFAHGAAANPGVFGHEWAGTVEAVGPDVDGLQPGDRVLCGVSAACGRCRMCAAGRAPHCETVLAQALAADPYATPHGGFAGGIVVRAERLLPVDPRLSDDEAALVEPAAVAVHAVARARPRPDDTVVVLGSGPIGLFTLQVVRNATSAPAAVVEPRAERAALARDLGAGVTLSPAEASAAIADLTHNRGADLVFECSGAPGALSHATSLARRGGTVVLVGLAHRPEEIDPRDWLVREITVAASFIYTRDDFETTQTLIAEGRLRVAQAVGRIVGLSAIEQTLAELEHGRGPVKVLVDPAAST
jgi:(R,R)-butanediol dehydrogenase/meso-butanediol dehydrogenase/diacetyl reductase